MSQAQTVPLSRRPVESRDPNTGETWATYRSAEGIEVEAAVARARAALPAWRARPLRDRAAVVERFRHLIAGRRDEVAAVLAREIGKPRVEAFMEVLITADFARFYARNAQRILRTRKLRAASLALWRKRIRVEYEPWGVIGVITPWNYPLLLSSGIVLPALVAGNTVVMKPSEYAPTIALKLAELLRDSGIPEHVLQVLQGDGITGAALIDCPIDKLFFVGSAAAGRAVATRAGAKLLPCVLELGGSDPAIVLEDADLRTAAAGIVWSRFTNAGQTCVAPKRLLVVDAVYDEFLRHLEHTVKRLRVGRDADMGPLIRPVQRQAIETQLREALDRGARIGARAEEGEGEGEGEGEKGDCFFSPTVLTDVTKDMKVLREETFGPLLPVIRVRDAQEAIEQANKSSFGLAASIWSRNIPRATEMARRIEAGTVSINDAAIVAAVAEVPHGGVKASGTGRSHGDEGLLECVRTKAIIIDSWPRWRESYWQTGSHAAAGFGSFIEFAHGRGVFARLAAGIRAVRRLYLHRH